MAIINNKLQTLVNNNVPILTKGTTQSTMLIRKTVWGRREYMKILLPAVQFFCKLEIALRNKIQKEGRKERRKAKGRGERKKKEQKKRKGKKKKRKGKEEKRKHYSTMALSHQSVYHLVN